MVDEASLRRAVLQIMDLLAGGRYKELESLTKGERLSASEIQRAVEGYGRTTIRAHGGTLWRNPVRIGETGCWSVYVDLWTEEEGRSDLTLELTVGESDDGYLDVQIDDLHVL